MIHIDKGISLDLSVCSGEQEIKNALNKAWYLMLVKNRKHYTAFAHLLVLAKQWLPPPPPPPPPLPSSSSPTTEKTDKIFHSYHIHSQSPFTDKWVSNVLRRAWEKFGMGVEQEMRLRCSDWTSLGFKQSFSWKAITESLLATDNEYVFRKWIHVEQYHLHPEVDLLRHLVLYGRNCATKWMEKYVDATWPMTRIPSDKNEHWILFQLINSQLNEEGYEKHHETNAVNIARKLKVLLRHFTFNCDVTDPNDNVSLLTYVKTVDVARMLLEKGFVYTADHAATVKLYPTVYQLCYETNAVNICQKIANMYRFAMWLDRNCRNPSFSITPAIAKGFLMEDFSELCCEEFFPYMDHKATSVVLYMLHRCLDTIRKCFKQNIFDIKLAHCWLKVAEEWAWYWPEKAPHVAAMLKEVIRIKTVKYKHVKRFF